MSDVSNRRSEEFLKISDQFQLGVLTTESSHPLTANLSQTAKEDVAQALRLLFDVDDDVLRKYREFCESGRAQAVQETVVRSLKNGGRLFFTGCGSTGRLSIQLVSIWRAFWQEQRARGLVCSPSTRDFENRAFSVMAGGDFALIKSVEGFEDLTEFGKRQLTDAEVSGGDVVFAITEGGETSFVIGTAWKAVEAGARVYFVYNNPDDLLCQNVKRSRDVILEPRIEKINLTTGPMAITGSTRMQATTIQLCVLLTVLEMALRELLGQLEPAGPCALEAAAVPSEFLRGLSQLHASLKSDPFLSNLAKAVRLEESVYRSGHKNNYFADRFGIDVLTDTTERSPTYCTPPFRKFDDAQAAPSWAYLFVPYADSTRAWEHILKRAPKCVDWSPEVVRELVGTENAIATGETVRKIGAAELMRFKIGLDGMIHRPFAPGDCAFGIVAEAEQASLLSPGGFFREQLDRARKGGARTSVIYLGREEGLSQMKDALARWNPECRVVPVPVPSTSFLLDGVTRAGLKMVLNALSTCTMVRLGRVMGNYMIWVVASNLKLIDRATRYIQRLSGLDYRAANRLLFEVIEYVEPRMKADQAYPPVVGVAVMRVRHQLSNEQAEARLRAELSASA